MAFFTDTHSANTGLSARVSAWWSSVKEENARRRIRRTTYAELASLSNRDLADLGIARGEISRIAREAGETL